MSCLLLYLQVCCWIVVPPTTSWQQPKLLNLVKIFRSLFLCFFGPIDVYLAENSSIVFHQIVHLPVQYADGTIYTVEFRIIPVLNHAIILGMPFVHAFNPNINCKIYTITCQYPQLTSILPPVVPAAPLD